MGRTHTASSNQKILWSKDQIRERAPRTRSQHLIKKLKDQGIFDKSMVVKDNDEKVQDPVENIEIHN